MRKEHETEINGTRYKMIQLPFKEAGPLFMDVLKKVGPGMAMAAAGNTNATKALGVKEVLERLSWDDLERYAGLFGKVCQIEVDDKWPYLDAKRRDEVFTGKLLDFTKWIQWCAEVNYGDFLGELRRLSEQDQPPEENQEE